MDDRLMQQIAFSNTLDGLKSVLRRNMLMDSSRRENSAEHSWHMAVLSMVMLEYAPQSVDPFHAMKMMLIHDVVEIDAGDTFCYDTAGYEDKAEREQKAAQRIFGLLPKEQCHSLRALWDEFEACETAEAKFANALDRFQVLMQNMESNGGTWPLYGIPKSKVLERMAAVQEGAPALWPVVLSMLEKAVAQGVLEDDTHNE